MTRESHFQNDLIRRLRRMFPGCIILKNDPEYLIGVPDIILLWEDRWAALECKRSENADRGPNQIYYIRLMSRMSFAAFIYPENEEIVLHDLQQAFRPSGPARISRAQ